MGRALALVVTLCALSACGETTKNKSTSAGTGGTNGSDGGAHGSGAGADGGAAGAPTGAPASCADQCAPCEVDQVLVACDPCICEPADSPDKPVIQKLAACDLDEPCPPSMRFDTPGSSTWHDGVCMLTAFRDRTPGKYQHLITLVEGEGTYRNNTTFLIGGGDEVLVLSTTLNHPDSDENILRKYWRVWSCPLKGYEALDNCIDTGTDLPGNTGASPPFCDATDDWLGTCKPAIDPVCPGE